MNFEPKVKIAGNEPWDVTTIVGVGFWMQFISAFPLQQFRKRSESMTRGVEELQGGGTNFWTENLGGYKTLGGGTKLWSAFLGGD